MQQYQRLSFSSGISLAPRPSSAAHWTLDAAKVARTINRSVPKSEKERGERRPPIPTLTRLLRAKGRMVS
jgi:hypothetical protein